MPIEQIDPNEAYNRMHDADHPAVYLDVRTAEEFEAAHPENACNIPVLLRDATGRMIPNSDFLSSVEARLAKDARVVVGCMMGGRSQKACEIMAQAGYTDVANVVGGFGGSPHAQGWRQLGLPVVTG